MDTLVYIFDILIVVLGVAFIIFIHELGHFSVAKWLNMKVEAFSIGFGKVLWSFTRGETEYRLSLIPLGGYVKLSGETPDQKTGSERDFCNRPASHRALVLVAGVAMNAISAVAMLLAAYLIGIKEVAPEVGEVVPGSPAALELGFERGDVIKEINGAPVHDFSELMQEAALAGGDPLSITFERAGALTTKTVTPVYSEGRGLYSIGVFPRPLAQVKVLQENLKDSGLKLWDQITGLQVDGAWQEIKYFDELTEALTENQGTPLVVRGLRRDGSSFEATLNPSPLRPLLGFTCQTPETSWLQSLGEPPETPLLIATVLEGYPAEEMGIKPGDVIESATVGGSKTKLSNLKEMQTFLANHPDDEILLHWQTKEGQKSASFTPKKNWALGFVPMNNFQVNQISFSEPGLLVAAAFRKARNDLLNILRSLKSFITGTVAAKNINGPITIARVSMVFVELGIGSYLAFLAMISFNLAILNILPIPLLDGGHLMMVGVEKLIGRQVDERVQIAFQYVGMALLGSLMLLAFYNDIFHAF